MRPEEQIQQNVASGAVGQSADPGLGPRMQPPPGPGVTPVQAGMGMPQPQIPDPATMPTRTPTLPRDPDARMDIWRDLLSNFTFSLARGLSARAANPRAGVGEALMGSFDLEARKLADRKAQQLIEYQKAQEERAKAASEEAMARIKENEAKLPLELQNLLLNAGYKGAQTANTQANTAATNATYPAKVQNIEADTKLKQQEAQVKTLLKVGDKVYSVADLVKGGADIKPLVGSDDEISFTVTKQLADGIGQPELAGKTVSAKVGKELTSILSTATKQATTAEGVNSRNLITGETTRLGSPAVEARPISVLGDSGIPQVVSAGTAIREGMTQGTLSDTNKLTGQAASFANFHSNADRVRELLPAIGKAGATERIAAAMAQPASTLGQYIQGQLATGNLSNDEYDLINALGTFREDIFNLRQFFGNAPIRSDKQVSLMLSQVPDIKDLTTGNPAQVARKIDNFERAIHAIEAKYGPLQQLLRRQGRPKAGAGAASTTPPAAPPPEADNDVVVGPDGKIQVINNKQKKGGG